MDIEKENEYLRACLAKANAQAEHFEREWYLRGDELECLRTKLTGIPAVPESMSPINRLIAYAACAKLRAIGYEWSDAEEEWSKVESSAQDNDFPLGQACDLSGEGSCESCQ